MANWDKLANDQSIQTTIDSLQKNGIEAEIVATSKEAKKRVLKIIPPQAEVLTMTSETLNAASLTDEINKKDGQYKPIRDKLYSMDRNTQKQEMNRLGAAPEYAVGSVHAVTEDGRLLIASNSGSQLPSYVYAAGKVILVVGAQKIVKNTDEGIKRIYEYVLPLEDKRAQKAYGVSSNVSKLLIINKEVATGRLRVIIVKEKLGF